MGEKPTVYLESSVIGYLTNRLSRDLIVAAHQQVTRTWWKKRRNQFELFISDFVIDEIGKGDNTASNARRLQVEGLPSLELKEEIPVLAEALMKGTGLPLKAFSDTLHIAMTAVHGLDYLLTWNCKHIANAEIIDGIIEVCTEFGFRAPIICTPLELMGGKNDS